MFSFCKKYPCPGGINLNLGLTRIKDWEHTSPNTEVYCVCQSSSSFVVIWWLYNSVWKYRGKHGRPFSAALLGVYLCPLSPRYVIIRERSSYLMARTRRFLHVVILFKLLKFSHTKEKLWNMNEWNQVTFMSAIWSKHLNKRCIHSSLDVQLRFLFASTHSLLFVWGTSSSISDGEIKDDWGLGHRRYVVDKGILVQCTVIHFQIALKSFTLSTEILRSGRAA